MDLLMSIKDFYKELVDLKIVEKIPEYEIIEKIADEVYDNNYSSLDKFIVITLAPENYEKLKKAEEHIKEIVNDEKNN